MEAGVGSLDAGGFSSYHRCRGSHCRSLVVMWLVLDCWKWHRMAKRYRQEVQLLLNDLASKATQKSASNIDALVYGVLVDEGVDSEEMRRFLYRDRNNRCLYQKPSLLSRFIASVVPKNWPCFAESRTVPGSRSRSNGLPQDARRELLVELVRR